ncbi:MAG: DUF805 domain-containing protein, partial [Akkermansia sp.]|nr:DUF805 domain-containing protein [Akkermansia sp.]
FISIPSLKNMLLTLLTGPAMKLTYAPAGDGQYSFGQAIASCFKRYAKFDGRARRSEYWWFYLMTSVVSFIPIIGFIGALACIVPMIAVGWRRMHDIGKPGWFILIPIYSLYLAAQPSVGPNEFGAAPAEPEK